MIKICSISLHYGLLCIHTEFNTICCNTLLLALPDSHGQNSARFLGCSVLIGSISRGEWPSGSVGFRQLAKVKLGCARSATGWATIQINDQSNSLRRPSEGTLN